MSRQWLGAFGRGASDEELGAALANVCCDGADWATAAGRGRIEGIAGPALGPGPRDAAVEASAWSQRAAAIAQGRPAARYGIALELVAPASGPSDDLGALDLRALLATLGRGTLVSAVSVVTAPARAPAEWVWPLELALCDDPPSAALRSIVAHLQWRRFFTIADARHATAPVELLLLPGDLRASLASMLAHPRLPRVQAVLVLGGVGDAEAPIAMAEQLRLRAGADAVVIADVADGARHAFLDAMLVELSHDLDLDVAIAQASRTHGAPPPLCVAARSALRSAHLGSWARRVAVQLQRSPMQAPLLRASPPHELGRELLARLPSSQFGSELGDASDVAELGHAARAMPPPPLAPRERFVQAELFTGPAADAPQVHDGPLGPGTYRLDVWIGAPQRGAIVAPAAFPEEQLPPSAQGHELTIAFTAPGRPPQVAHVTLAPEGPTARVAFALDVGERDTELEARLVVLHGNRILQTLVFSAVAGDRPITPLSLSLEAVVRRDLEAAAVRRDFEVALITNQLGGASTVSAFAGDRASIVQTSDDVARVTKEIAAALEQATNQDKKYGTPDTKGTSDLLAALARKGVLLRDALLQMGGVKDELAQATRIQILVARTDAPTLPLEICYDGPAPGDQAATCPSWEAALASGACQPACPADRSTVVCPVAFWGMTRTIERHAYSKATAAQLGAAAYALQTEPAGGRVRLPIANGSLCAAAAAARAVDAAAVDQAFDLAGTVATPETEAKDWPHWRTQISANPSLLVLLSHTDDDGNGTRLLVIDQAEKLYISSIDPTYVGKGGGQGPIVMLLGCTTAIAELAFQSFVERFRLGGAAIVVGTLCEVLGRHAAPIASELIAEIGGAAKQPDGVALGELLPAIRRRLLARGFPIVMAIAVYGDADWRI
jgi:hypothetical protein